MNLEITESKILVCDDSFTNTLIVSELLKSDGYHDVEVFNAPEQALEALADKHYDLMLLDIEMPKMDGIEVMQQMQILELVDDYFPIIILTGVRDRSIRRQALELGAVDYINKPLDQDEILLRVRNTLKLHAAYKFKEKVSASLEDQVNERTTELLKTKNLLIERLATLGELKDNDTGRHVLRVGAYAQLIAQKHGLPPDLSELIGKAAPLHDLGKIAIPEAILLKNGPLNDEEWRIMKTHAEMGKSLLADIDSDVARIASSITVTHHENWDGSGYPEGLAGESIPLEGRITAISDVFDALISKRSYKGAWTLEQAVEEIKSLAGTKFDPNLVQIFIDNIEGITEIYHRFSE